MASFTRLLYHCIFSTKERRPMVASAYRGRLHEYLGGIARNSGWHALRVGGTADHVHLLIELNGSTAVADAMRVIKTNSSKWVHETFPQRSGFAWQTGYAAFTVSASATGNVCRYIDTQESHHRKRTFKEELLAFLERDGVEYDERHIWE